MSRGNPEDWKDRSIPQPDVVASQDAKFVKSFQQFTLDNPHPGYGNDPNIINQYGHTLYPKMIYPNGKDVAGVIVNSEEEEKVLIKPDNSDKKSSEKDNWS